MAGTERDPAQAEKQSRSDERRAQRKAARAAEKGARGKVACPEPDVLRRRLARRRAWGPAASALSAALAREQEFRDRCPAYRDSAPLSEDDVVVEIEDVALCVASRFAEKLKIPWEMIQTVRGYAVGGLMLDVGANIGQTSVPRILLGDFQAVYAAEPTPANYARLRHAVEANSVRGFVLPDRLAIGSRDGVLRLLNGHYRSHRAAADSETDVVEVPCLRLDSWVERLNVDADAISFVKVDTNGFETDVLRGATALLGRGRAVWQLEVAPDFMGRIGTPLEALCAEIRHHFTHFVDLGKNAFGSRTRRTDELSASLEYLKDAPASRSGKAPQTDLLCFNL